MTKLPKVVWRSFAQQIKYFEWANQTCGTPKRLTSCRLNTTTRDQPDTFPAWRTSGEDAPLDGAQNMAPVEVAAGAASVEVAADADPAENQDPEADGWPDTTSVWHVLTQRHRRSG